MFPAVVYLEKIQNLILGTRLAKLGEIGRWAEPKVFEKEFRWLGKYIRGHRRTALEGGGDGVVRRSAVAWTFSCEDGWK